MNNRHAVILLTLLTGTAAPVCAEDADRPKVGLVLSGGGARGAAHVGVIKELQRQNIPIDVITGTSMGAIVGGLYAAGTSIEDLEAAMVDTDWKARLKDEPDRRALSFRRKQDESGFLIDYELGFRDGKVRQPLGFIQGQQSELLLDQLTARVSGHVDFDDLPIPFRAVTTDIVTGEEVVFDEGELSKVLAASMAVPGAFEPVTIGDHRLVDGGLTNNLPIDVARELGAEVIIAVDIATPLMSEEEMTSAISVGEQMIAIMLARQVDLQIKTLKDTDVLIVPELGDVTATAFEKAGELVPLGAKATREAADRLAHIALSDDEYALYFAGLDLPAYVEPTIDFIEIENNTRASTKLIESQLTMQPGDKLNPEQVEHDLGRIYGLGYFDKVRYRIVERDGLMGMVINVNEKPWGPTYLKFGVDLEGSFEGSSALNIATRITRLGINPLGAEWRTDLQIGDNALLYSEFYQPFDQTQRFFIAPQVLAERRNVGIFEMGNRIAEAKIREANLIIDFGMHYSNWGELRLGYIGGNGSIRPSTGIVQREDFDNGAMSLLFTYDNIDNAAFPSTGSFVSFEWDAQRDSLGADRNTDSLKLDTFTALTPGGKNTLALGTNFATTLDNAGGIPETVTLGGFARLPGFNPNELSGLHLAHVGLAYYRRYRESQSFGLPLYTGLTLETGNVWDTSDQIDINDLIYATSLWVGADTPLGPLYLAWGYAEGGHTATYLFIGRAFSVLPFSRR